MNDQINRRDLDIILEVNRKSVELETEVAEQNEKIIELLDEVLENNKEIKKEISDSHSKIIIETKDLDSLITDSQKEIISHVSKFNDQLTKDLKLTEANMLAKIKIIEDFISGINKKTEENSKDIFTVRMVLASGLFTLIIQIIQLFFKK